MEAVNPENLDAPEALLAQAYDQIAQANLFSDFATDLNASLNVYEALLATCAYFRQLDGFHQVAAVVVDATDSLTGLRDSPAQPGAVEKFSVEGPGGPLAALLQDGQAVLCPPEDVKDFERLLGHPDAKCVIAAPLDARRGRAGCLIVATLEDAWPAENTLATVENAARPLATAIERIVSFEKSRLQATTDPLTKLFNRRFFLDTLENELHKSKRVDYSLGLLMIDIDHFKQVNDTYGHLAGDQVLAATAAMVAKTIRDVDTAARYGGEEFVVILVGCTDEGLMIIAERVRWAVAEHVRIEAAPPESQHLTISVGAALASPAMRTAEELIAVADGALYEAKSTGRNRVVRAQSGSS